MAYAIKIVYKDGRKKVVGSHPSHEAAMKEKLRLMKKTQEEDTEYYIIPAERNRKGKP